MEGSSIVSARGNIHSLAFADKVVFEPANWNLIPTRKFSCLYEKPTFDQTAALYSWAHLSEPCRTQVICCAPISYWTKIVVV